MLSAKPERLIVFGLSGVAVGTFGAVHARASAAAVPSHREASQTDVQLEKGHPGAQSGRSTQGQDAGPVTREELGRHTWTFLHTLAAQYPDNPTRQEQKDASQLVDILCRLYPCSDCAAHFAAYTRDHPPTVKSGRDLSRWMCEAHNNANALLGKPEYDCSRVSSRWQLDCGESGCARGKPKGGARKGSSKEISGVENF